MNNLFFGISIMIVIASAMTFIMQYFRQPLLIGHILTGVIVGPAALSIIDSPDALTVFGTFGIALLLFIIGLGMNPRVVREVGRPSLIIAAAQLIALMPIAYLLLSALGLKSDQAIFVSFGLGLSSTIVALKLLSDKRETTRLHGKLIIGSSLIQDVIAAIALLLVASAKNGHVLSGGPLFGLIVKGLAIGAAMYVVSTQVLIHTKKFIANDQEILFLFAIAWALGSAALFEKAGFSLEVGALAAGVSLAHLPYAHEMAARLRPLRDFFVIVFFIALGTELSLKGINDLILPIVVSIALVTIIKPLAIMTTLGIMGYTKRTSFKTALTLSQVSEFSIILVILGVTQGLIDQPIVSMLTITALISIAISTYLVTYSDKLYKKFEDHLSIFERDLTNEEEAVIKPHEAILFGYAKGGSEFIKLFKRLKKSFVVIDYDPEIIEHLEQKDINYLYGDATDIELLEESGVLKADLVISTINDFNTSSTILKYIDGKNPSCVVICQAHSAEEATKLYRLGASYVILPHLISSEKITEFIKKEGLSRSAFTSFRNKHLKYLEAEFGALDQAEIKDRRVGKAVLHSIENLVKK